VQVNARGLGLLAGLEFLMPDGSPATKLALATIKLLLHRGLIFLPEGEHANVISFTPPLTISERQLRTALEAVGEALRTASGR
jgi:4-aminobutyrate aminotransferase-like enzyme